MWFQSTCAIRYYPWGDWWVIAECCEELASYYRMQAENHLGFKLNKPKHGAHISIVRGEGEPRNKEMWMLHSGEGMTFEYCHEMTFGPTHVWLPVRSWQLTKLRTDLGLEESPQFGFHLTLGKLPE